MSDLSSIYTGDTVYVPLKEEDECALLEISYGCSWRKCSFCDFVKDDFCIHSLEKVENSLKVLSTYHQEFDRMFFLGDNSFVLEASYILSIIKLVNTYLPQMKEFAMYARVDDILRKTPDELKSLREHGLTTLHIGLESGSDEILSRIKKGVDSSQAIKALHMLDDAGIEYCVTIIMGIGGRRLSREHAIMTANLLNKVNPIHIWCLKLILWEGTSLYEEYKHGEFEPMTPLEILIEERQMFSLLENKNCRFDDTTVLNTFTIHGFLPEDKDKILTAMDMMINKAKGEIFG